VSAQAHDAMCEDSMEQNSQSDLPQWPVIVFEPDDEAGVYTREEWYGDPDLCDSGSWSDSAEMVDSTGAVFHIEFRVVREGRFLLVIPYQTVTNDLVRTGRRMPAHEFASRLADDLRRYEESGRTPESYLDFIRGVPADEVFRESIRYLGSS